MKTNCKNKQKDYNDIFQRIKSYTICSMRGHITYKCDQYKNKLIKKTTLKEFVKKYHIPKIECISHASGSKTLSQIFHGNMKYSFSLGFYGLSLIELGTYNGTVIAQYRDVKRASDGKIQVEAPLNYVNLTDNSVVALRLYSHIDEAINKGYEMLDTLFNIKISYYKEKLADLQKLAKEMSLRWNNGELTLDDEEIKALVDILRTAILYEMEKETQLFTKCDLV